MFLSLGSKKKCYPLNIERGEEKTSVPLQDLFNHTATRIIEFLNFQLKIDYQL